MLWSLWGLVLIDASAALGMTGGGGWHDRAGGYEGVGGGELCYGPSGNADVFLDENWQVFRHISG